MASAFKRKDRHGRKRDVWEYKYRGATGKWLYGTGWPDKAKTLQHAQSVEAECRAIRKGEKDDTTATLQKRNAPVSEAIAGFMAWGKSHGGRLHRGWDEQNEKLTLVYLTRWTEQLGLAKLNDISLERVEKVIRQEQGEGFAPKTILLKVQALKGLINWGLKNDYLTRNPLKNLGRLDSKAMSPHRKMTDEEVAALLNTAPPVRRLWYETGLGTGFRVDELRLLRVRDLDLFGPSLIQPAEFSKDRKPHRQPITKALAEKLSKLTDGKAPDMPLLDIPTSKAWKIFKRDCVEADIPLEVKELIGERTITRKTTWHSLRKVYISNLFASGLDLKTIQTLGRLSSTELAVEVYAAADPALLRAGAAAAAQRVQEAVSASACCTRVAQQVAVAGGQTVSAGCESHLQQVIQIGATGFEPATSASRTQRSKPS